jgi:hypothetical protein
MLKCFSPLRILTSPLFEETLGAFIFLPLFSVFQYFFSLFFYGPSLEDIGVSSYVRRKITSSKTLFKWLDMECHGHDCGYIGGGHIFHNGVMHANIAKP